jgi:hypothetical protein
MSEIRKYQMAMRHRTNPRYMTKNFVVPLYTGSEPDIYDTQEPETEVAPEMVVPPQDVLPKNPEPVMPSVPGIPNPQDRILELSTGGGVKNQTPKFIPMDLESVAFRLFRENLDNLTYNEKQTVYDYIEENRNKKSKGGRAEFSEGDIAKTSKDISKLSFNPTAMGDFLETSLGQTLSKSAPNLLKATTKLAVVTGTPLNTLLGVALYAEENKEKGLSDLETIAAGAYKGSTQDLLNFGDLIFRKLPAATYEKFIEDKPFLESLLNKPEYFEFADKQIDKYASEKSIQDRIQNRAEYEVRKSFIPNVSDTEVPDTTTSEEYKNLVKSKIDEKK